MSGEREAFYRHLDLKPFEHIQVRSGGKNPLIRVTYDERQGSQASRITRQIEIHPVKPGNLIPAQASFFAYGREGRRHTRRLLQMISLDLNPFDDDKPGDLPENEGLQSEPDIKSTVEWTVIAADLFNQAVEKHPSWLVRSRGRSGFIKIVLDDSAYRKRFGGYIRGPGRRIYLPELGL